MDQETDEWLRTVASTAYNRETGELLYTLMAHRERSNDLPSYEPLLVRVREVLVTRYDVLHVEHLLRHLNVPRRDTMLRSTD